MKDEYERKSNRVAGTIKEAAGKMIHSERLELEGKLQKMDGNLSGEGIQAAEELKERVAEKANDLLDLLDKKLDEKRNG